MDSSYRHLAFLLSLGGIPLACTGDDTSSGSNTDATTTTDPTTGSTSNSTTDPTATATTGMSGTASESGMTEATTDPTATTGTSETDPTATTDETTSTTGEGTVCENFATFYAECDGGRDAYDQGLTGCEEWLLEAGDISAECELAVANYHACAPSLTCEEYAEALGCVEEQAAITAACLPEPGDVCEAYGAKYDECRGDGEGEAGSDQRQIGFVD